MTKAEVHSDIIRTIIRIRTIKNTAKGKVWKSQDSVPEQLEGRKITDISI